jgi:hypothetical protein
MSINDLPAIMGTVLIVAGLVLVGVSTWSRAEGSEKTTQAGALIIVVGAFLLGLAIFVSHGNGTQVRTPLKLGHYRPFWSDGRQTGSYLETAFCEGVGRMPKS